MMEHVQGRVSQDDGEGVDEDDNHPDIQEPGQYICTVYKYSKKKVRK